MKRHISSEKKKYLLLLSEQYASVEALYADIARLNAQLSLPKGTEHFMSDIHGEYEAFAHIMNNCSGVIREKVHLWLGNQLTGAEEDELCTLIYYPESVLQQYHQQKDPDPGWLNAQVEKLVYLARMLSSKYTRNEVRNRMPEKWSFLLDELMHYQNDESEIVAEQNDNRRRYHEAVLNSLIGISACDGLMIALAQLIKALAVDRLHVVGDIFDRGPRADSIMDILMQHHAVDIEWGNHDILWMGAASGSNVCIAGVVRNCLAYNNTIILERGYGIPLRALTLFAEKEYPELPLGKAMLHAVTVIMFKLEGQLIRRNPDFGLEDRLLLHRIDREKQSIGICDRVWPVREFPLTTVSADDAYMLTEDEQNLLAELNHAFRHSSRLRRHIAFLYQTGSIYRTFNGNLLYHGCIPMEGDGSFKTVRVNGQQLAGREYMDYTDQMARNAFYSDDIKAKDFMWFLWCGDDSPLCGRKVKTFARYFIPDQAAWSEPRNAYYEYCNAEDTCRQILEMFSLSIDSGHIINGHTPVRVTHGESPLKAGGKLIVIDGGFCKAYQKTTGIAGYTLIANSHGMRLMSHQPFTSLQEARESGQDIHSQSFEFEVFPRRLYISDTDDGRSLRARMTDLYLLLDAYRQGIISLKQ